MLLLLSQWGLWGTLGGVSSRGESFGYKPALDGLRAVAVLAVILYHLDYHWARGGYLGVDTFFVLSGYLITSLLLTEWERGARELAVADDEGMTGGEESMLNRVRRAIAALGADQETEQPAAGTKHG